MSRKFLSFPLKLKSLFEGSKLMYIYGVTQKYKFLSFFKNDDKCWDSELEKGVE